jgi:2-keto-4-pentenoate hydratase/2-oxohepta-3-ene-1,7-dioic acid hydratase in catechol pathway
MKIGRFRLGEKIFYGNVEQKKVIPLAGGPFGEEITLAASSYRLADLRLLPPCIPSKAVCVGLNYRDHAAEFGHEIPAEPILFIKPSTALLDPEEAIVLPAASERVDYEAELAVVIGKTCRKVSTEESASYILGYTCANDVTARDLQQRDGQWTRAKSFDTFLPLGPYIENAVDPFDLGVCLYLNGALKQKSSTANLIFSVYELVSFISGVMTLNPGDVILTGTPGGVGQLTAGDQVVVEISGIGRLSNAVRKEVEI